MSQQDDDEGWLEMPIVRADDSAVTLDEEDRVKYKYQAKDHDIPSAIGADKRDHPSISATQAGDTQDAEELYTRLRIDEDEEEGQMFEKTRFLFDDDQHAQDTSPLAQLQATKNLLSEQQRIAYVGLCRTLLQEMIDTMYTLVRVANASAERHQIDKHPAIQSLRDWAAVIMGRLFTHMDLDSEEQKMIESLTAHGVLASDLSPSLQTTRHIPNPEYTPPNEEACHSANVKGPSANQDSEVSDTRYPQKEPQSETLDVDIRYTILCDLFLALIADSVYDARSRVLLLRLGDKLEVPIHDVIRFEKRITDALEIQEGVERMKHSDTIASRETSGKKRRYVMMGLATVGGGLVIGLSAGLLAPVIGAGLGVAFSTVGITGTSAFLTGAAGSALITTGGVITGSSIATKGMSRRTQAVRHFELKTIHNAKRVSCALTVSGYMSSIEDDVRIPFSGLDPVLGDLFSVLWEPEMMSELGNALRILANEVLTTVGQQVLQATVLAALMSALQFPLLLTKLGYLIDNPWSNALDRAKQVGLVLADILVKRHMGDRPITLIGFSLGARVIFYALVELARLKAFGVIQEVYLCGTTVTASLATWRDCRSVVSGRFVNCYARNDWLLGYLFRATSGGIGTVAGLRPVESVPGLENQDVTDLINGHMSYAERMPRILKHLNFVLYPSALEEIQAAEAAEAADPMPSAAPVEQEELESDRYKREVAERKRQVIEKRLEEEASSGIQPGRFARFFGLKNKVTGPLTTEHGTVSKQDKADTRQNRSEVQNEEEAVAKLQHDESPARMADIGPAAGFDVKAIQESIRSHANDAAMQSVPNLHSTRQDASLSVAPQSLTRSASMTGVLFSRSTLNPASETSDHVSSLSLSSTGPSSQPPTKKSYARWTAPAQAPGPAMLVFAGSDGDISGIQETG